MTAHTFRLTARFLLTLLPFTALAQGDAPAPADKGVKFEDNLSWAAIKAKAKAENKYIFMDCYTTWCGPCKYMARTIFPQEETGAFFNDKFISVGVQLDTTAKDDARVKSWYADGHNIAGEYDVRAYPTYLIFSPDGRPLHRLVGSRATAKEFIDDMQSTFDTTKQYYTQLQQYRDGRRDSAFLRRVAKMCAGVYDMKDGREIADAYAATQGDPYSHGVLELTLRYTQNTKDKGFALLASHPEKVDEVMGNGAAEEAMFAIFYRYDIYPAIRKAGTGTPDWKAIRKSIAAECPAVADEMTEKAEAVYYQQKKDWSRFQTSVMDYMKKYGAHASAGDLNNFAWTVFQNCPDMTCVSEALDWSKRSFEGKPNPTFMDTYANILYKLGKKDEAITWEQKAVDMADEGTKASLQPTLDKMKKGEKTWN
ncbi:MAG TPA: thioredoxin family protein [Puia sp.]|nr:thioredoxin family protein [Puia sp.]